MNVNFSVFFDTTILWHDLWCFLLSLESFLTLPLSLFRLCNPIALELDYNSLHLDYEFGQNAIPQGSGLVCLTRSNPLPVTLVPVTQTQRTNELDVKSLYYLTFSKKWNMTSKTSFSPIFPFCTSWYIRKRLVFWCFHRYRKRSSTWNGLIRRQYFVFNLVAVIVQ